MGCTLQTIPVEITQQESLLTDQLLQVVNGFHLKLQANYLNCTLDSCMHVRQGLLERDIAHFLLCTA